MSHSAYKLFFLRCSKILIGSTKHKILKNPVQWECWWAPLKAKSSFSYCKQCPAWHLLYRLPQVHVTHLADGAHGSHVALIAGAELGGCQQPCGIQAVQAPVDGDFAHCSQVTVAPDLKLWRMLTGYPGNFGWGKKGKERKKERYSIKSKWSHQEWE